MKRMSSSNEAEGAILNCKKTGRQVRFELSPDFFVLADPVLPGGIHLAFEFEFDGAFPGIGADIAHENAPDIG